MTIRLMTAGILSVMAAHCMEAVTSDAAAASTSAKATPIVDKVTMTDGRVVEFVGKKRMLKETKIIKDEATGKVASILVTFDFKNGQTRTFDVLASGLWAELAGHGAEQKIGDATAGVTDVEEMVLEVDDLIKRLSEGKFNAERGEGFSGVPALARAVHEYQLAQGKDKTLEQITEFVKGKTTAERAALKLHPQIKAILDRMEAEKAAKAGNVDVGALLDNI